MVYADAGFLVSAYVPEQTSPQAIALVSVATEQVMLPPLVELEMRNAMQRMVFVKRKSETERDQAWSGLDQDIALGRLARVGVDSGMLVQKARELTDKYTPTIGTRTLDLLHVAAALLLQATEFWSFDDRQRKVAQAEGLVVKP